MKLLVNIARILVGSLFIFSGLVKAIDPLGLAYKMQEFFEVWSDSGYLPGVMNWLHHYATGFSIFMITLEVVLGVALLVGWQRRLTTWLLFLLTLFFTFLTSYVLFSGKIRACGCFGDCIPLTPIQTFTKDVILTVLIIILLIGQKHIKPWFSGWFSNLKVAAATIVVLWLQFYVLKHLPVKDCLPYKVGNNILELRQMPKDAVQDKYSYSFIYEKDGQQKSFDVSALPDSSWKFIERKQVLIEKGHNNVPLINDFSFTTTSGTDTTESILGQQGQYYLLFVKDVPGDKELKATQAFLDKRDKQKPLYIITSQPKEINTIFNHNPATVLPVFSCDGTAIKTAARTNPALFLMNGAVIAGKWSWADLPE
ncbi:MAG: DoxX family membrane protein [Bacteroidetes bacterium]|nr:DoxX family membrane protein [Bacteroidota bacterium]